MRVAEEYIFETIIIGAKILGIGFLIFAITTAIDEFLWCGFNDFIGAILIFVIASFFVGNFMQIFLM